MLLNGYAGYSTVSHLGTGLQKVGVLGRKTYWSRTGWKPRTRCLVVREPDLIVQTIGRIPLRQNPHQLTLFKVLQRSLRTA